MSLRGTKTAHYFEVRLQYLDEHFHDGVIYHARVITEDQRADGFIKPLPWSAFFQFAENLYSPFDRSLPAPPVCGSYAGYGLMATVRRRSVLRYLSRKLSFITVHTTARRCVI